MASWINPVESERPKRPFAAPERGVAASMASMGSKEARFATVWLYFGSSLAAARPLRALDYSVCSPDSFACTHLQSDDLDLPRLTFGVRHDLLEKRFGSGHDQVKKNTDLQ